MLSGPAVPLALLLCEQNFGSAEACIRPIEGSYFAVRGGLGGQSHSSVFFQLPLSFPLEDPTKLTIPLSLFTWRKSSKTALSNLLLDTVARRKGHLEFSFQ